MNDAVLLHLVNSTCKPILLYPSECVCITRSDVITVTKAWNQIFYQLFRVNNQDCINDIRMYFGIKSISDETSSRQNRFMQSWQEVTILFSDFCVLFILHKFSSVWILM